jgi:septal ring factor EnvC (AmiA/AmiB activator)
MDHLNSGQVLYLVLTHKLKQEQTLLLSLTGLVNLAQLSHLLQHVLPQLQQQLPQLQQQVPQLQQQLPQLQQQLPQLQQQVPQLQQQLPQLQQQQLQQPPQQLQPLPVLLEQIVEQHIMSKIVHIIFMNGMQVVSVYSLARSMVANIF